MILWQRKLIRDGREAGMSLVELLVAMMVFSILLVLVGTLYVTSQRVVTSSRYTATDTGVASNVMNELTNVLRFGTVLPDPTDAQNSLAAFVSATPTQLVLYSYADASENGATPGSTLTPVMVGFFLNSDGTVTEKRWNFVGSSPPNASTVTSVTPDKTINLGGPLVAPTTQSTPAGACLDPNATTAPTAGPTAGATAVPPLFTYCDSNSVIPFSSGTVPSARFLDISSVSVNISMNTGADQRERAVVLSGTVDIQNLGTKSAES